MNWSTLANRIRVPRGQPEAEPSLRHRLHLWRRRMFLFLAVIGPGLITSNVDNDAGGIATYSQAGAQFGYGLLWIVLPLTVVLYITQEMCARMGVFTGKGLSDLIREEFGFRSTFFVMLAGLLVDLGNTIAEFAGVAASMSLFGVSKYIAVPVAASSNSPISAASVPCTRCSSGVVRYRSRFSSRYFGTWRQGFEPSGRRPQTSARLNIFDSTPSVRLA